MSLFSTIAHYGPGLDPFLDIDTTALEFLPGGWQYRTRSWKSTPPASSTRRPHTPSSPRVPARGRQRPDEECGSAHVGAPASLAMSLSLGQPRQVISGRSETATLQLSPPSSDCHTVSPCPA